MTALVLLRRVPIVQPALAAGVLLLAVLALACVLARTAWATGFGVEAFGQTIEAGSHWPAAQAGSHPSALTTTVTFEHTVVREEESYEENPKGEEIATGEPEVVARIGGNPRDLTLNLPAGMVLDPDAIKEKCTEAELETSASAGGGCPAAAAAGVVTVFVSGLGEKVKAAVYAMQAPEGVPAELGVDAGGVGLVMHITGHIRSDEDDGLSAEVSEISQAVSIYGLRLTLWGDPSDPSHDAQRGVCASSGTVQKAIEKEEFENEVRKHGPSNRRYDFDCPTEASDAPLLTLPGSCTGEPLETTLSATSWQSPEVAVKPGPATLAPVTGCESLPFDPTLEAAPEPAAVAAESPSGLNVALKLPHEEGPSGLAQADVRQLTLTLPPGMAISPAAAGGLEACAIAPAGAAVSCPEASKLGEMEVVTPLLERPLRGGVYLAQPNALSGSLVGLYLTAAGDGVAVDLDATAALDPSTGRVTLTLAGAPQLPVAEVRVRLFGGPRAPLQTPAACGPYTVTAQLTPWSGGEAAQRASTFAIASGCAHPFAPTFAAGVSDARAGASTPFTVTVSRAAGEQQLAGIDVTGPPGLTAALASVPRCSDAQAIAGECPEASALGQATLALGPGSDPYSAPAGTIYLTGPYEGAPLGLEVAFDVRAGPFSLGRFLARARVTVDPHTAQLQIVSDPLPTILDGVPLDIRTIALRIDRLGFVLDPTDCASAAVEGTLTSTVGAAAAVSSPFAVAGCASLPFEPALHAYTPARTSRSAGAGLSVRVVSGAGQANIGRVRLILPAQLPGRLSTLRHACPAPTFDADPAACPAASRVGIGDAHTRVLAHPLVGPAYLVSHGGEAFPDIVFVLWSEGIAIYLDGSLDIRHGLISATFDSIPDIPVDSFAARFPEGPDSVFGADLPARAHGLMCGRSLYMPSEISAHDGALVAKTIRIAVTGCPRHRLARAKRGGRIQAEYSGRSPGEHRGLGGRSARR